MPFISKESVTNTGDTKATQLRRIKTVMFLITIIAIAAVLFAVYAFMQKKEADVQADTARQREIEALQQQAIGMEQKIIADSSKELATKQRELANESEKDAREQTEIARAEAIKAEINKLEAVRQKYLADTQTLIANIQRAKADSTAEEIVKVNKVVTQQIDFAKTAQLTSNKLKELLNSRSLAQESVLLLNEHHIDSSRDKAVLAYQLNKTNKGPQQNSDIYNALNSNWMQSIGNKNQSRMHVQPVRCVTGMPNTNIIFTGDESGLLIESVMQNNSLHKIASYPIKDEIRAMAIAPDGTKLIIVTFSGVGFVFNVSASGMSASGNFKFLGFGKAVSFTDANTFIVITNKAVAKYQLRDLTNPVVINKEGINAFAASRNGKIYIAADNQVSIYQQWNQLMSGAQPAIIKYDSKVTAVAADANDQYMAVGTGNGFVCITSLKNNKLLWSRGLHLSSVNDIKFATAGVAGNTMLQLASAGADQTIKLVNISGILQNAQEDIITLKGHTKWIHTLYYTPDGHWLFSTGSDNKVIAWKPTMDELYQTLK